MPEVDAGPTQDYDDNTEWLIDTLPPYMEDAKGEGNWSLLWPIGERFDELDDNIDEVDRASSVTFADTIDQLDEHAKLVSEKRRGSESKEHYRSRLIARYQLNTNTGSIKEFIEGAATIIDVSISDVTYIDYYREFNVRGVVGLRIPSQSVEQLDISAEELAKILQDITPAGREVRAQLSGTFQYVSAQEYEQRDDWTDYQYGYDGLDDDGNPKEEGGTYAGTLT